MAASSSIKINATHPLLDTPRVPAPTRHRRYIAPNAVAFLLHSNSNSNSTSSLNSFKKVKDSKTLIFVLIKP